MSPQIPEIDLQVKSEEGTDYGSAAGPTWRSRVWRLVRVVVALGLLTLVVSRVDWKEVGVVLSQARLAFLPLIFLIGTLDRLWMAGKWNYLLQGLGVRVGFFAVVRHYYLGGLLGAAVQSQLGGDIARASAVGRRAGRTRVVAASVVIEKAVGFIAAGILAGASLLLVRYRYEVSGAVWLAAAIPVGLAIAMVPTLAYPQLAASLLLRLLNIFPGLAGKLRLAGMLTNRARLQQAGSTLRRFFALTLAEQLVPLANLYLLKEALRLDLSGYAILAFTPLIMFFARLPISIEALGIYEGLSIYLFGLAGLSAASALALALLDRVMGLVVLGVGGLVCAWASRSRR
ncbi:MAG: lysylphosphatidylglycerol synthase transmembrane domain-containing protein [Gemmatimonadales bacterium]